MKIIQKKYKTAEEVLELQELKVGIMPRFLTYCIAVACDDGVLLHNTMTKELLLLEENEANALNPDDLNTSQVLSQTDTPLFASLYENWYIVPQDHDDKELCLSLRTVARQLHEARNAGKLESFTILTTTACNARCFYCYEHGAKYEDMSRETALKVLDFIKRSCGGEKVHLSWFGGEPLYNLEPIELITEGLQKEGIRYHSFLISNGYLFDEALVNKAREKWHLSNVQITLDGTEKVYNRRKAYIYKGVNAFQRVTDNIELLLKADIHVNVRLNLDEKNYDDLLALADYLTARYSKYNKFSAYTQYLNNARKGCPFDGDVYTLDKYKRTLDERLGMKDRRRRLAPYISIYRCMSDGPSAVLIQTNGNLGKCEHYFNSHPCGSIDKGICDAEEVALFKKADTYLEACNSCPIYPNCIRLAMCPNSFANSKEKTTSECVGKVDETKASMLTCYKRSNN